MTQVQNDQELMLVVNAGVSPPIHDDQELMLVVEQRLSPPINFVCVDQELMLVVERRNPRTALTGGHFQGADGRPLAGGYLVIKLSTDAMSPEGQVVAGVGVTVPLGSDGNVSGAFALWATNLLDAGGDSVFYVVTVYSSGGQRVWGPYAQQIPNVPVYDIGNFSPTVPA